MFKAKQPLHSDGDAGQRPDSWNIPDRHTASSFDQPAPVAAPLRASPDIAIASSANHAAPFAHYADGPSPAASLRGNQPGDGGRTRGKKRGHDDVVGDTAAALASLSTGPAGDPSAKRRRGPAEAASAEASGSSTSAGTTAAPAPASGAVLSDPDLGRQTFQIGQHGAKPREQKRLTEAHGFKVSGKTHQSEHPIGFEPLNQTSGESRRASGRANNLENRAPAYQEVLQPHRDHIGTGSSGQADGSGMNAEQYRTAQRALVESGQAGAAVQLNQLGYAFDPGFVSADARHRDAARDSYGTMVNSTNSVTYAQNDKWATVPVSTTEKLEMHAARWAAENRQWPTHEVLNGFRAQLDLPLHDKAAPAGDVEMADAAPKGAGRA